MNRNCMRKWGKNPGVSALVHQTKKDSLMVQRYSMWAFLARQRHLHSLLSCHHIGAGVKMCPLQVFRPRGIKPAVTGQEAPDDCQSSSFSICWNASKSSRQSASNSSTDWLLESVWPSGFAPSSESLSSCGCTTPTSSSSCVWLTSSSGEVTSSAGLVSSFTALTPSCDGETSSGAISSSSNVLICDWLIGSNEVGVVFSVKCSSSASGTTIPGRKAGACDAQLNTNRYAGHTIHTPLLPT